MVIFTFQSEDLFWNKNILMGAICFVVQKTLPDLQSQGMLVLGSISKYYKNKG